MAASIEAQLAQLAQRKAKLEEELRDVEKQVYSLETSYLNDSAVYGNVLRGFEAFLGPAKPQKCVHTCACACTCGGNSPLLRHRARPPACA